MNIYGTEYDSGIDGSFISYQDFANFFNVIPLNICKITQISSGVKIITSSSQSNWDAPPPLPSGYGPRRSHLAKK